MRKGIFALEEMETPVENLAPVETPVEEFAETAEADLIDAAAVEAEHEEIADLVEESSETAETLGEIQEEMGRSVEEGGMSEPEAAALEVAVEHLCSRIGLPKKSFPAMESFKDKTGRIQATKMAMEEIGEQAKKIWQGIVSWLTKAIEVVKTFFKHVFDAAAKLEARAKKLAADAKGLGDKKIAADAKIKLSSYAKMLNKDGAQIEGADLVAAYKKHTGTNAVAADFVKAFNDVEGDVVKAIDAGTPEALTKAGEDLADAFAKIIGGKAEGTVVDELVFNGAKLSVEFDKSSVSVSLTQGSKKNEAVEAAALQADVAGDLAALVETQLGKYKDAAKAVDTAEKSFAALLAKVKASMSKEKTDAQYVSATLHNLKKLTVDAAAAVKSYDVKIAKGALDIVQSSLAKAAAPEAKAA